jgi:DNA polymerase sigma
LLLREPLFSEIKVVPSRTPHLSVKDARTGFNVDLTLPESATNSDILFKDSKHLNEARALWVDEEMKRFKHARDLIRILKLLLSRHKASVGTSNTGGIGGYALSVWVLWFLHMRENICPWRIGLHERDNLGGHWKAGAWWNPILGGHELSDNERELANIAIKVHSDPPPYTTPGIPSIGLLLMDFLRVFGSGPFSPMYYDLDWEYIPRTQTSKAIVKKKFQFE